MPADLRACFGRLVPAPEQGALSRKQIFKIIADLKRSELTKDQCGQRLIAWYETQAAVMGD